MDAPLAAPILPCTYSAMQFSFATPVRLDGLADGTEAVLPLLVCGQTVRPFTMNFAGEVGVFGAMVQPATYRRLFGAAMSDLVDHAYEASVLLGSTRARRLYTELERHRQQPAALVATFERF